MAVHLSTIAVSHKRAYSPTTHTDPPPDGSPHRGHIHLIRSFHRPSDDACTYQYLIPSNMMFSSALNATSFIIDKVSPHKTILPSRMRRMSTGINRGIMNHAIINNPKFGNIYAYKIDG